MKPSPVTQILVGVPSAGVAAADPTKAEPYINVLLSNGFIGIAYAQWFQIFAAMLCIILIGKNLYSLFKWAREAFSD